MSVAVRLGVTESATGTLRLAGITVTSSVPVTDVQVDRSIIGNLNKTYNLKSVTFERSSRKFKELNLKQLVQKT